MSSSVDFPIIGIGASAGGIDAFHLFFQNMPAKCGMAFVVILHLPADRKSMLTEILARWTSMQVIEVTNRVAIKPERVYVPPPHAIVTLEDGHLIVEMPPAGSERVLRPIDAFFDSLGSALRERAVGIVLSGTGSDGSLGLKAIKECGGLTIAQGSNGTSPEYGEMPAGAIATGAVDLVAPVEDMPSHLLRLRERSTGLNDPHLDASTTDTLRLEICEILLSQLGHDFSGYRSQTFLRRVDRRMRVVNAATLPEYIVRLKDDHAEVTHLFRDLLIRVTSFFRDEETFEILAAKVIPRLFEDKHADGTVRIWVPGCATGEEAYSLAILLREYLDSLKGAPRVQLFATDIDEPAIATARLGRYPKTLIEGLSAERRGRFFDFSNGSYAVAKEIRDLCTFSLHNLIRDPPFSTMSLVSCRNLLIYMNTELQNRVIPVFHYSLIPGGMLLLGSSESVAQHSGLFATVDKAARIFRRLPGRSPELQMQWQRLPQDMRQSSDPGTTSRGTHTARGNMPSLQLPSPVERFKELLGDDPVDPGTGAHLRGAIKILCEELQSLGEEHQTALEELRSANEELHSVNEEMQSTNEELETGKEELQALNEELHTVNFRLTEKVDELNHTNSDLKNLFESTQIATVFLDRHLVIRSFTPAITGVYSLIPSDLGRPLTDIVSHLKYASLREDVAFVLSTLAPLERRVDRDDHTIQYIMRIVPYREPDSTVTGALVTFIDVTNIVKAEEALVAADVRKDVFLATLSHELRNPLAPIRTAGELLQSPKLSPEDLNRARSIIGRQVTHMSSLLDDLLDVSRITRGTFLLKKEYASIRAVMDDAIEAVRGALDAKRHTLRVDSPSDRPVVVEVDPVRITQALTNLLTNAVKYTPPGGIIELGTEVGAQFLTIFVRDNGVGLSSESMRNVFTMFTRVDSEVGRREGGLGIGLALAKGLVQLHGGRIDVKSAGPGLGSEFMICLPRSLIVDAPPAVSAVPANGTSTHRKVLLADDNRDAAESLSMLLKLSDHEVHLAYSGGEAFEAAKKLRPDICVLDIGMPDLNGYELAERIRREAWGKKMILIALTGWGQESDKHRAVLAGFDQHFTKPVDPAQLAKYFEVAAK